MVCTFHSKCGILNHLSLVLRFADTAEGSFMATFPRRIALLGSTGSIGQQTLDVVRCFPDQFQIVALAARSNVALLSQQVREFKPSLVACFADMSEAEEKAHRLLPEALLGEQGLLAAAT